MKGLHLIFPSSSAQLYKIPQSHTLILNALNYHGVVVQQKVH